MTGGMPVTSACALKHNHTLDLGSEKELTGQQKAGGHAPKMYCVADLFPDNVNNCPHPHCVHESRTLVRADQIFVIAVMMGPLRSVAETRAACVK